MTDKSYPYRANYFNNKKGGLDKSSPYKNINHQSTADKSYPFSVNYVNNKMVRLMNQAPTKEQPPTI